MQPTRAIIFDCFGVIFRDAFQDFIEEHRERLPRPEQYYYDLSDKSDLNQLPSQELYAELAKVTGELPFVIQNRIEDYVTSINYETVRLITELKPHFSIGLISNINRDFLDTFLDSHALRPLFDHIIASSEVGHLKPDREIFSAMADTIDVPFEQWIFVDDRPGNVAGAQKHGIPSHRFTSPQDLRMYLSRRGVLPVAG